VDGKERRRQLIASKKHQSRPGIPAFSFLLQFEVALLRMMDDTRAEAHSKKHPELALLMGSNEYEKLHILKLCITVTFHRISHPPTIVIFLLD
jgi:hypothetical protein